MKLLAIEDILHSFSGVIRLYYSSAILLYYSSVDGFKAVPTKMPVPSAASLSLFPSRFYDVTTPKSKANLRTIFIVK